MIRWKIYKDEQRKWNYGIAYNESSEITRISGGFNTSKPFFCYERNSIEFRRIKYLEQKLFDILIHIEDLTKRFGSKAAKELLGI